MTQQQYERNNLIMAKIRAKFTTLRALAKAVGVSNSTLNHLLGKARNGDAQAMERLNAYIESAQPNVYTQQEFDALKKTFKEKMGGNHAELRRMYFEDTGKRSSNLSCVITGRKPRKATPTIKWMTAKFAEL
jgi:lambda repressor-like predicted transcriptional regulator